VPTKGRGAVIGMFSLFGAVGILLVAKLGGTFFVEVSRVGPFKLIGIANFVVLLLAVVVLKLDPDPDQA